jgi:hypothetical protein
VLIGNLKGDVNLLNLLKRHIDSETFDEQSNKMG